MKPSTNEDAIRILSIGDVHLKAGRDKHGPWIQAFKRVVEIAVANKVHAVANVGDTRVDCNSSPDANDVETRHLILPLARAGIAYWTIDGNHDRRGSAHGEVTANSWLQHQKDADLWKGVEYWNDSNMKTMTLNGQRIQVVPLPYPPRHVFALGKDLKTKQELDVAASEYIQNQLYIANKGDPEKPLLILFHGTVDSPRLQTAGEARMPAGHDVNIPINAFEDIFTHSGYAVACGHIHMAQVISEGNNHPLVFYTGPLVPQDFDSEDLECGATLIDFIDGYVQREFVPIETIKYKTVVVDLRGDDWANNAEEITRQVTAQVPNPDRTVVKIVVRVQDAHIIDKGAVREALEEAGIIEPRISVELPESPAVQEMEQKIEAEIGGNVQANVTAYLGEHPEAGTALAAVGAGEQDCLDAAAEIEREAFDE